MAGAQSKCLSLYAEVVQDFFFLHGREDKTNVRITVCVEQKREIMWISYQ